MTNKDLSLLASEVITLIGQENLDKLNPFGQRAVVVSLLELYQEEGTMRSGSMTARQPFPKGANASPYGNHEVKDGKRNH